MEHFVFNKIDDKNYQGMISFLDNECSIKKLISGFLVPIQCQNKNNVIVDLAAKVGINKYRFLTFDLAENGVIIWESGTYITPDDELRDLATAILSDKKDLTENSMLPTFEKKKILLKQK